MLAVFSGIGGTSDKCFFFAAAAAAAAAVRVNSLRRALSGSTHPARATVEGVPRFFLSRNLGASEPLPKTDLGKRQTNKNATRYTITG